MQTDLLGVFFLKLLIGTLAQFTSPLSISKKSRNDPLEVAVMYHDGQLVPEKQAAMLAQLMSSRK